MELRPRKGRLAVTASASKLPAASTSVASPEARQSNVSLPTGRKTFSRLGGSASKEKNLDHAVDEAILQQTPFSSIVKVVADAETLGTSVAKNDAVQPARDNDTLQETLPSMQNKAPKKKVTEGLVLDNTDEHRNSASSDIAREGDVIKIEERSEAVHVSSEKASERKHRRRRRKCACTDTVASELSQLKGTMGSMNSNEDLGGSTPLCIIMDITFEKMVRDATSLDISPCEKEEDIVQVVGDNQNYVAALDGLKEAGSVPNSTEEQDIPEKSGSSDIAGEGGVMQLDKRNKTGQLSRKKRRSDRKGTDSLKTDPSELDSCQLERAKDHHISPIVNIGDDFGGATSFHSTTNSGKQVETLSSRRKKSSKKRVETDTKRLESMPNVMLESQLMDYGMRKENSSLETKDIKKCADSWEEPTEPRLGLCNVEECNTLRNSGSEEIAMEGGAIQKQLSGRKAKPGSSEIEGENESMQLAERSGIVRLSSEKASDRKNLSSRKGSGRLRTNLSESEVCQVERAMGNHISPVVNTSDDLGGIISLDSISSETREQRLSIRGKKSSKKKRVDINRNFLDDSVLNVTLESEFTDSGTTKKNSSFKKIDIQKCANSLEEHNKGNVEEHDALKTSGSSVILMEEGVIEGQLSSKKTAGKKDWIKKSRDVSMDPSESEVVKDNLEFPVTDTSDDKQVKALKETVGPLEQVSQPGLQDTFEKVNPAPAKEVVNLAIDANGQEPSNGHNTKELSMYKSAEKEWVKCIEDKEEVQSREGCSYVNQVDNEFDGNNNKSHEDEDDDVEKIAKAFVNSLKANLLHDQKPRLQGGETPEKHSLGGPKHSEGDHRHAGVELLWSPETGLPLANSNNISSTSQKNIKNSVSFWNVDKNLVDGLMVPPVGPSRLNKLAKKHQDKLAGEKWFNMSAPIITPEMKKDLQILKLRGVVDPKRHYKADDSKGLPKHFQVGTVVSSPADFYSGRLTKKEQKNSLADELLADSAVSIYRKRKYSEIQNQKQAGGKMFLKKKGKRTPSWAKI